MDLAHDYWLFFFVPVLPFFASAVIQRIHSCSSNQVVPQMMIPTRKQLLPFYDREVACIVDMNGSA
jgi:hypothetical protein